MCETCNPLGLAQPASTQVHGTVFVAVLIAVILLAVLGRVALSGVGPFRAEVTGVAPAGDGLAITLAITNAGTKQGATTCRISRAGQGGFSPTALVQSPFVQGGATATFETTTEVFGSASVALTADCDNP
jgi:hypothetical protein